MAVGVRQPVSGSRRAGRTLLVAIALVSASCGPTRPAAVQRVVHPPTASARTVRPVGSRVMPAPPLHGFAVGAGVSPINLLPGQGEQPTGPALVHLLQRDGIRILRLVAETPDPQPALYRALHDGGWRQVFGELEAAHIEAILLVGGEAGVDGVRSPGSWPPEPPFPGFPGPGQAVEPTRQWIANQGAILADVERQCHGFPASLVGIEVANEPLVDAATIPMLRRDIAAVHREAPGIPLTIGGWRAPARTPGERWDFNDPVDTGLVAPLVDFVSAHLYLNDLPVLPGGGGDLSGTTPGVYVPAARAFLAHVVALSEGKPVFVGEFGGLDGRPETVPGQPSGGSPAHQAAVIEASVQAMAAEASSGVTGGTAWLLEESAGPGYTCTPWDLICFGQAPLPALQALSSDAKRLDR